MNSIRSWYGNLVKAPEQIEMSTSLKIFLRRHLANQLKEK